MGTWLSLFPRLSWDRNGRLPSYLCCGTLGFLVALALLCLLFPRQHALLAWIVPSAVFFFFAAVKLGRIVFHIERIVCYEVSLFVLAGVSSVLWLRGLPVLAGGDLLMLGIAVFLIFGRLGCLMVGCCHGRPARHGICYPPGHAQAGFPAYLVGTPLLPIQLLESIGVLFLSIWGAWHLLGPHAPGSVLAGILGGYGLLRFFLELGRGDALRPVWGELSEAQWTALILAWALVPVRHRLDMPRFSLAAALVLTLAALALFALRGRLAWTPWWLRAPDRVLSLYHTVAALRPSRAGEIVMAQTSFGLRMTLSVHEEGALVTRRYGLSRTDGVLDAVAAGVLAEQIRRCFTDQPAVQLKEGGRQGIFHLALSGSAISRLPGSA